MCSSASRARVRARVRDDDTRRDLNGASRQRRQHTHTHIQRSRARVRVAHNTGEPRDFILVSLCRATVSERVVSQRETVPRPKRTHTHTLAERLASAPNTHTDTHSHAIYTVCHQIQSVRLSHKSVSAVSAYRPISNALQLCFSQSASQHPKNRISFADFRGARVFCCLGVCLCVHRSVAISCSSVRVSV